MPITLKQLTSNTAPVDFTFLDNPVHLEYRPGAFTEKTLMIMGSLEGVKDGDKILAGLHDINQELCRLIVSWDVMEDDGVTMFPLDADRVSELPFLFRIECFKQMSGVAMMGEANGTPSSSPSLVTSLVEESASSSSEQD